MFLAIFPVLQRLDSIQFKIFDTPTFVLQNPYVFHNRCQYQYRLNQVPRGAISSICFYVFILRTIFNFVQTIAVTHRLKINQFFLFNNLIGDLMYSILNNSTQIHLTLLLLFITFFFLEYRPQTNNIFLDFCHFIYIHIIKNYLYITKTT